MTAVRSFVRGSADIGRILLGLYAHHRHGEPSERAWRSLLSLHCRTNGRSSDRLAKLLRRLRPPRPALAATGLVGTLSSERLRAIADQIAKDGYYVFEQLVPADFCDAIEKFALETPAAVEGRGRSPDERIRFDPNVPISKTYRVLIEEIVKNPAMQRLMADRSLLAVAEAYLKAHPILSGINLWWSPSFGDTPGDDAAQMFHFDFDGAPVWLKFFIYLTDVGHANGPHVFVRGSHAADNPAAAGILRRGYVRVSDDEISKAFGADNVIEICGRRGTVLAVDTRGFHKGKMPTSGHRLIAQLMYCCPHFNYDGPRQRLPNAVDPLLAEAKRATPQVFERFS